MATKVPSLEKVVEQIQDLIKNEQDSINTLLHRLQLLQVYFINKDTILILNLIINNQKLKKLSLL
ncbi:hypothetical protein [Nostoc sp.]|uniref:hypothetical protein n=1 Tax=Nostoc sp. TaxID=1180 RepID=UPI002FFBD67C